MRRRPRHRGVEQVPAFMGSFARELDDGCRPTSSRHGHGRTIGRLFTCAITRVRGGRHHRTRSSPSMRTRAAPARRHAAGPAACRAFSLLLRESCGHRVTSAGTSRCSSRSGMSTSIVYALLDGVRSGRRWPPRARCGPIDRPEVPAGESAVVTSAQSFAEAAPLQVRRRVEHLLLYRAALRALHSDHDDVTQRSFRPGSLRSQAS